MAVDNLYVNGVIAVKETSLLKDKIYRMCELGADDAFRMLTESGFGGEAVSGCHEYEKLVASDSAQIDAFIREYAPNNAVSEYLLSPRDFHNAKALVKAERIGSDGTQMLAPEGLVPIEVLRACFKNEDFNALESELKQAVLTAREYIKEDNVSGAQLGFIFDRALFKRLFRVCKRDKLLSKFVADKADMTNILIALRSSGENLSEESFLEGGTLKKGQLARLAAMDEKTVKEYASSPLYGFICDCFEAKQNGAPYTAAERRLSSYEGAQLYKNQYELKGSLPFMSYVFRRRLENENVRIVFASLLNGMDDKQIKSRLRGVNQI